MEKLAKEKPDSVTEMIAMMGVGPVANPLHRKMNESHITQVLDLAAKHDEREFELQKTAQNHERDDAQSFRRYTFATFVIATALIVLLVVTFREKPEVLVPLLSGVGGLLGGFAAGFGVGKSRQGD